MNSAENWALQIDSAVHKLLEGVPAKDRDRVYFTIRSLALNPFAGDIQKMKGERDTWRRRIGSYRIFYEVISSNRTIYVFRAERRKSNTY